MNWDPFPKHPTSERRAAWFHVYVAVLGLFHLLIAAAMVYASTAILVWAVYWVAVTGHTIAGVLMMWYHLAGAVRHWKDREPKPKRGSASKGSRSGR